MRRAVLALIAVIVSAAAGAQNIPSAPVPPRLVNDFAGLFGSAGRQEMEDSLVAFDRATSTQIAVVTVNDLDGYAASDYALAIMRGWGVGRKGRDNGIVLLIKPRNGYGRGEVYISVGTGLEGVLNDGKAGRIIDHFMMEDLAKGDYTSAALKGTAALRAAVRGEFTADEEEYDGETAHIIAEIILLAVIILVIAASTRSGGNGHGFGRGTFFPPIFFGGGRGFGGGGGFSGGGFGGFGGGSGSGGGAGRSF